jgi:hypothetical protein
MRLHTLFIVALPLLFGGLLAGCGESRVSATPAPATEAPTSATNTLVSGEEITRVLTVTAASSPAATITTTVATTATITATAASTATGTTTEELVLIPTDTVSATVPATAATTASTTPDAARRDVTTPGEVAPGTVLNAAFIERVSAAAINQASQLFYPTSNLLEAAYDVDIYRLQVQSTDELGGAIDLQTDLYIPRASAATQFPVLAYAPGTTGLGDSCAPSQEILLGRAWGSYYTQMLSYAGQGLIGVLPDGMSYDDPERPHEYFIAELEAHTLLDAARGAYNFLADPATVIVAEPLDALFFAGYSNGGHTAFAAKDFAAEYAPELPLRGVISHGATTNVETLMRESPLFTPYLIYAYQFFYGSEVITPAQVFTQNWLPTFAQDVNTKCVDEIFVYYSNDPLAMYQPAFRRVLENDELADELPLFKTVLDANYAGTFGGFDIPVVFFQGTADGTITPRAQQQFAQDLCERGQPVTYVALPTVRHVDTRQRSFGATLEWMRTLADGGTVENNCGGLTGE